MIASPMTWPVAVQTVLLGTSVFVLGQLAQRFIIEPIHEQRKAIGEISNALLFYGNIAHAGANTGRDFTIHYPDEPHEASRTIRALAARLRSTLWTIPAYGLWAALGIIPRRRSILEASTHLIGWSNSLYDGMPGIPRKKIAELLQLPPEA
jgi:hypothetical protein